MSTNTKRLQLLARRKDVAQLYVQGFTQIKIADLGAAVG